MKTLKSTFFIFVLIIPFFVYSQVGIGTTTPDASSVLDIVASNKGILIPRVSLINVTTTMLDGTNAAATGLLIYNTNTSVVGGNGVGYYMFNGTIWEQLITSSFSVLDDNDWYEESTTNAPNNINDDMFTMGNVAIGKNTADYPLDVSNNSAWRGINIELSGTDNAPRTGIYSSVTNIGDNGHTGFSNFLTVDGNGNHWGIRTNVSGSGSGIKWGITNSVFGTGTGIHAGTRNSVNGSGDGEHGGTDNLIQGLGNGLQYGTRNIIKFNSGNGLQYGVLNELEGSGSGIHYGIYNLLSGLGSGDKYASFNEIEINAGGTHYGVYSEVLKIGSFAGYFLGNVSIGTTTANNYIFPASRGTVNQIMQTDGNGAITWVDGSIIGSSDADWFEEGTTNAPNDINDDMFTQGNVAIGKTTADYALDIEETTADRAIYVNMNANSNSDHSGIYVRNSSTGLGLHHGVYNDMRFGNGAKFGVRNDLTAFNSEASGVLNNMTGNGSGTYKGINNFIDARGTGIKYGCYTRNGSFAEGDIYGVYSSVLKPGNSFAGFFVGNFAIGTESNTSLTPNYYILPPLRGTSNQIMQTDAAGNVSWVDDTSVGTDNQNISGSGLSGTTITIGIQNGTSEAIDLSSLQDGVGTDNQNLTGATLTGNTLQIDIENGTSTSVDLSGLNTGGDITNVTAGTGLTGGGATGAVTLNVVATNGLTANANDIVLGGTLTQATTITQGTNNLAFNLNNSGDFLVQDNGVNVFEVRDNGIIYFGSDTFWKDVNTGGTNIGALIDDGDDGRFLIYENGILSVDLDANTGFVFNEQGLDRDFRIEGDGEANLFYVDAGNDRIGIMDATPSFDLHLKQSTNTQGGAGGIGFENSTNTDDWKIYHSGFNLSFSENGTRRAYITGGTGAYVATSDRRLKKNITDVESILSQVNALKTYRYLYKDQDASAKKTIGFMAQDIQPLFPELVETGEDGYLGLNYAGFGVIAIKAIQEQQELINSLQTTIEGQDEKIITLETLLNKKDKEFLELENRIQKIEALLNSKN